MNDNNNTPKGWGKSNNGDTKESPWENKSKTSTWGNSPSDSAWKNTSANSEKRSSKSNGANSPDVSAAVNKFASIAKKAGEKAAGAAKNAVDYAKSDETAEKLNSLKDKAGSAVSEVGSKLSGIKNKATDKISEHRNKSADPDDNSSEQSIEDTYESETYIDEVSGYEENRESSATAPVENQEDYSDTTETIEEVDTPKNTPPPFPNKNNRTSAYNTRNYNAQEQQRPAETPLRETSSPGYIIQKQKTSPVLIIVIIVLVLVVGVLVGMFFVMNRKDKKESSKSSSSVSEVEETTAEITGTVTKSETQTKTTEITAEITTEINTTTPTTNNINKVSPEEFDATLSEFLNGYTLDEDCRNPEYGMLDVNSDGVFELFVKYETMIGSAVEMYVYKDSSFISTNINLDGLRICQSENIIQSILSEGGSKYSFYHLNDSDQLELFDELTSYAGQYYQFKNLISEKEFNDYLSDYNNKYTWSVPVFTAFKAANQTGNNESQNNIPSEYSGMDNIVNAPSDMQFYSSDNIATGYVVTESTSLNMRAGAGADYKVVTEIPKGAEVEIFGENSEWYYVKYIKEKKPHPDVYLGFVSRQYISKN